MNPEDPWTWLEGHESPQYGRKLRRWALCFVLIILLGSCLLLLTGCSEKSRSALKDYFANTKRTYGVFIEDGNGRRAGASATFESLPQK